MLLLNTSIVPVALVDSYAAYFCRSTTSADVHAYSDFDAKFLSQYAVVATSSAMLTL